MFITTSKSNVLFLPILTDNIYSEWLYCTQGRHVTLWRCSYFIVDAVISVVNVRL